jgi:glutamine---fructose-6-phosphate transaminase (isomerizing)
MRALRGARAAAGAPNAARAVPAHAMNGNKQLSGPIEYYFASDASAVIEHTRRVVYLEDGDIVHIRKQGTAPRAGT